MSELAQEHTKSLSSSGCIVKDVKFYYRPGCTKEDLEDFRDKAWAQINTGVSQTDTSTNW